MNDTKEKQEKYSSEDYEAVVLDSFLCPLHIIQALAIIIVVKPPLLTVIGLGCIVVFAGLMTYASLNLCILYKQVGVKTNSYFLSSKFFKDIVTVKREHLAALILLYPVCRVITALWNS